MRRRILIWTVLFGAVMTTTALAQSGALSGTVTSAVTGEALPGVHIRLFDGERFHAGAYSTIDGAFAIRAIPTGSYRLVTS